MDNRDIYMHVHGSIADRWDLSKSLLRIDLAGFVSVLRRVTVDFVEH
jgi:hypothetical protein